MTTDILPFDGGETPEPVTKPAVGHWVTVKDDDKVGDDAGQIVADVGQHRYIVEFYRMDGTIYRIGKYLQEEMTFVGYEEPS